jgi:F-type H+-transporting ATPase subunit b
MEERENKMAAGLEAAKQADDSLEEAKLTYEKELKEAKKEAANIVEKANNRSSQILNDAKAKAEIEAEKIIESGSKKLENETNKTREELKQQLSSIVVETASKIIDEEIDEKKHENIIKKAAKEI